MYPITQLFHKRSKELNLSKPEAVKKAGYRNIGKGLRRLEDFLATGSDTGGLIICNLPAILELPSETVEQAVRETALQLEQERIAEIERQNAIGREAFKPFLFAFTERKIPTQITICGLVGGDRHRYIELLNNVPALSPEEQNDSIRSAIAACLKRFNGFIPFFDRIRHFVLVRDFDAPVHERTVFDLGGYPIPDAPDEMKHISHGHTRVTLAGKPNARIDGIRAYGPNRKS